MAMMIRPAGALEGSGLCPSLVWSCGAYPLPASAGSPHHNPGRKPWVGAPRLSAPHLTPRVRDLHMPLPRPNGANYVSPGQRPGTKATHKP